MFRLLHNVLNDDICTDVVVDIDLKMKKKSLNEQPLIAKQILQERWFHGYLILLQYINVKKP